MRAPSWMMLVCGLAACAGAQADVPAAEPATSAEPSVATATASVARPPSESAPSAPSSSAPSATLPSVTAPATTAEYVIRWDPTVAGPRTAQEVVKLLSIQAKAPRKFEVEYHTMSSAPPVPAGSKAILRHRTRFAKNGTPDRFELTYKIRGETPLPSDLVCPLGEPFEGEVDVTILAGSSPKRRYAQSCELEDKTKFAPAQAQVGAKPTGCIAEMTRHEAKSADETRVEHWQLKNGQEILEVSRRGPETPEALALFEAEIAAPLMALKITPLADSKAEATGACAGTKKQP